MLQDIGELVVTKVCDFHKYDPAPLDKPEAYPGIRPDFSFVLHDDYVWSLTKSECHGKIDRTLEHMLDELNVDKLVDRVPVLGYGSNLNPAQLNVKFRKNHNNSSPLIVLLGELKNHDVVYASKISQYGVIPAVLESSIGTTVCIGINLLDSKQLDIMSETESGYKLTDLQTRVDLPIIQKQIKVKYYDCPRIISYNNNKPISLKEVFTHKRTNFEMSQREILDYVAKKVGHVSGKKLAYDIKLRTEQNMQDRVNEILSKESKHSKVDANA